MKRNYALMVVLYATIFNARAQSELYSGAKNYPDVVQMPYIHNDLLQDQHPEYWYEGEGASPGNWVRSQHIITRKDAANRFNMLARLVWNDLEARYDTLHGYQYTYKLDASGRETERVEYATYGAGAGEPNRYWRKFSYTYSGNRLSEIKRQDATTGSFQDHSTFSLFYDAQGNRIKDSVFYESDPTIKSMMYYTYNTQNKCVSKIQMFGQDTIEYHAYVYYNDQLAVVERYGREDNDEPFEKVYTVEYRYNDDGSVNTAMISHNFFPDPLEPTYLYKHYYNSGKKLTGLVSYSWNLNLNNWSPSDSIGIALKTNGSADTSYGYRPRTSGRWDANPSARYIFPAGPSTGLNGNAALHALPVTLYPNPAADVVCIDLGKPAASPVKVTVTDITGKVIERLNIVSAGSKLEVLSDKWDTGVYFVLVETAAGKGTRKLVISR